MEEEVVEEEEETLNGMESGEEEKGGEEALFLILVGWEVGALGRVERRFFLVFWCYEIRAGRGVGGREEEGEGRREK